MRDGCENRSIHIEIGKPGNCTYLKKWAYDFNLKVGRHFENIEDVNLEEIKKTQEQSEYMRLKEKFEKGE